MREQNTIDLLGLGLGLKLILILILELGLGLGFGLKFKLGLVRQSGAKQEKASRDLVKNESR